MSQENHFPDFVPKVGDLVQITRVSPDDIVEESMVLKRRMDFSDFGTQFISVEVGQCQMDRYHHDKTKNVWFQKMDGKRLSCDYKIEVLKKEIRDDDLS